MTEKWKFKTVLSALATFSNRECTTKGRSLLNSLQQTDIQRVAANTTWDSLRETLLVAKDMRLSLRVGANKNNPNLVREYESLIGRAHNALFEKIELRDYGSFRPIVSGQASLYSGVVQRPDGAKFIKVTTSATSQQERALFDAVSLGKMPREGKSYRFQIPDVILETPVAQVHLFEAIDNFNPTTLSLAVNKAGVKKLIWGLAEAVADIGVFSSNDCPEFLAKSELTLLPVDKKQIADAFPDLSRREINSLHKRQAFVVERWGVACASLANVKWGFAHGDLAQHNSTIVNGTVVFTDMENACFAPLGSDLFWLLYRNRSRPWAKAWIVNEFVKALRACGIDLSADEAARNALVFYCRKWLRPARTGTLKDLRHFRHTLGMAEHFVRDSCGAEEAASGGGFYKWLAGWRTKVAQWRHHARPPAQTNSSPG